MLSSGLLSKSIHAESGKVGKSSKLKVFSPRARVLKQGQSLLFLNIIRLLRMFLPQVKLKEPVATSHSKFNVEFFHGGGGGGADKMQRRNVCP